MLPNMILLISLKESILPWILCLNNLNIVHNFPELGQRLMSAFEFSMYSCQRVSIPHVNLTALKSIFG